MVERSDGGQYGARRSGRGRPLGRVDPWCAIAVVPILGVAGLFFWSGVAVLGVSLIGLVVVIVLVDSWSNRPLVKTAPPEPDDY